MAASLAEADDHHNNRTTIASLPKEVLAIVVEYASVDVKKVADVQLRIQIVEWGGGLGGLLRIGCVNRSFLEALKCVSTLRIEVLQRRRRGRFDDCVQRWCGIASRRLSGVLHISTVIDDNCEDLLRQPRRVFGPDQTRAIVDCAASFPGLRELVVHDVDPVAFCEQLRLQLRAGRLGGLRSLDLEPSASGIRNAYFRRKTRSAIHDTLHKIPVDLAMELLFKGFYPRMQAPHEGNYNEWTNAFFDVLSRGADIQSRPILYETIDMVINGLNEVQVFRAPGPQARRAVFARLYDTLEALIARGADPNVCVAAREYDWRRGTVLWHILDMLFEKWSYHRNVPDDAHSQLLFSFLMRTIDLLVRHGANSSRDDFGIDKAFQKLIPDCICARPDCTAPIREAFSRGDLGVYNTPAWRGSCIGIC